MVAICVRTLGHKPVECNARTLLFQAHAALERAAWIECGCLLREAVRVYLLAECQYHGCMPQSKHASKEIPPRFLAQALHKAGPLEKGCYGWIIEIIDMGNKAAHLSFVKPSLLATGIGLMHQFLDHSPYLVQPKTGGRA